MIVVPPGSFTMGAIGSYDTEAPQHLVKIPERFAVSKFVLTFDEWDTCVAYGECTKGLSDFGYGRGQRPAISVSWNDAQRYVRWLSKTTGKHYRLLTEAEYEYATRAGTQTAYPWGVDLKPDGRPMANCNGCGSSWDNLETAPVGSFPPNKFGLYDMVGNVWEWVQDCWHPNYNGAPFDGREWTTSCSEQLRTARGGSWADLSSQVVRSASRNRGGSDYRTMSLGFRVARSLATP